MKDAWPSTPPISRPHLGLLVAEPWRAGIELVSHRFARRAVVPRGDGHAVVLFPGLATDGKAMRTLHGLCRSLGLRPIDWGRGFNRGPSGDADAWLAALADDVAAALDREGGTQRASLVGWSLGGLYAREVAKCIGPRVRQVITLGTPFNADADHTRVGWLFRALSGAAAPVGPEFAARLRQPPPVATTSIYSRSDGIVAWQTCVHATHRRADVHDVEVNGSHIGMGWNPQVLRVVQERLARTDA